MRIWLVTDTHFYHDAMTLWCERPKNHTEIVGSNLLKMCNDPNDVLIHLGDIAIGKDHEAHEKYIQPLKCKKWLIRGNHDKRSNQWYLEHGWDCVAFKMQLRMYGKNITFSHAPIVEEKSLSTLYGLESFDINIHGHFHNTSHRTLEIYEKYLKNLTSKNRLLAIEYTHLRPVTLQHFIEKGHR